MPPASRTACQDGSRAGNTPEQLAAYIKSGIPKWAGIIRASGSKLE